MSSVGCRCFGFGQERGGNQSEPVVQDSVGDCDNKYPDPQGSRASELRHICQVYTLASVTHASNMRPWCW